MDPLQKWNPPLVSGSSHVTPAESSKEGVAAPQPSSSEQVMKGLGGPNPSFSPASVPSARWKVPAAVQGGEDRMGVGLASAGSP